MSKLSEIWYKIRRKWMKILLQPVRVFCFHQVSDAFDESTMEPIDWLQTEKFKQCIDSLRRNGYTFISLPVAHKKIKEDLFRFHKYAVLTADDGWASLKNILPWLNEQQIPITLFLNPAYLDGKHFRERDTEKYLMEEDVQNLHTQYPLLTMASHGWEHKNAKKQTDEDFEKSVCQAHKFLCRYPNYIPYFAYTWGQYSPQTNAILIKVGITPVTLDGKNYKNETCIDREVLTENVR